jgi:L-lactate dehydrogenase complex protein LldF
MRHWREDEFEKHLSPKAVRYGIAGWAFLAKRPALYKLYTRMATWFMKRWAGKKGKIEKMPLASGWTDWRDMPAPQGKTFMQAWKEQHKAGEQP